MDKIQYIQNLVKQLNTYRNEYYNLNKPSVSDLEYDSLIEELHTLESKTGFVLSNSPTQTVGYEVVSKLQKRQHPTPLKSLDKTKSVDELNKWRNNKDVILMLKADGLTVEVDYENGLFIEAATRGNGEIGELISTNALTFKNLPKQIPFRGKLRIAGEAVIHWNDFDEINSKLPEEEKYKTPRNLVAGSVRNLDSKKCAERNVYFYAFNILECGEVLSDSKYERFKWLGNQGFWIIGNMKIRENISEVDIDHMKETATLMNLGIDGLVASFDSVKYSNSLPETAHHPLHSLAIKFKDEAETTILKEIEWSVGRTGVITPVAIFDRVFLDNTEVTRASVHNLSIMEELELGIGDSISIVKANQIIPQIEENFTRSNNIIIPEKCPVCGGIVIIDQMNESKVLYCTNEDCSAKLIKKFAHFVSRDAMNIEGLSESTLEKFLDENWIETFSDIYRLERYKMNIIHTEGFGLRSYSNIIQAIEKSKTVSFEGFVYALGIEQIGKGGAKRLAKHFKNDINKFLGATKSYLNFTGIEDFGSITASAVYEYFFNKDNMNQVMELLQYVTIKQEGEKKMSSIDLSGITIVVTGEFILFKPRKKLEELIESLGGKLAGSVSKSTYALLTNDTTSGSKKNQTAQMYNVPIMSEDEFLQLIK
jgi:DNA ligase (NAD+)